jgi:hypothetical protein
MKALELIRDALALLGLVSTIVVVGVYLGYTTYQPACSNALSIFTKGCK